MILADNETKIDLLNNEAIAATIIKLLLDQPDQPVTVGVHGDWGAGKSSVLEMIAAGFEGEKKVLCLKLDRYIGTAYIVDTHIYLYLYQKTHFLVI
jgi:putative protein kinase ArgK-like GTPase of G3E family